MTPANTARVFRDGSRWVAVIGGGEGPTIRAFGPNPPSALTGLAAQMLRCGVGCDASVVSDELRVAWPERLAAQGYARIDLTEVRES